MARVSGLPLERASALSLHTVAEQSFPAWMPTRRTLGGFYVHRHLGGGSLGTVFVVTRAEERTDPDAERSATGYEQQEVVLRARLESGDILGLRVMPEGQIGRVHPMAWKLYESDRVVSPFGHQEGATYQGTDRQLIHGVEQDAFGAAVAYHVFKHPRNSGMVMRRNNDTVRIPAWGEQSALPTAVLVMTHHLATDLAFLREILPAGYGYIGLLGSKRRRETLLAELGELGLLEDPVVTDRLHAPVGLDLGGHHPATIALAIVAEIQAVLAGASGGFLRDKSGTIHPQALSLG